MKSFCPLKQPTSSNSKSRPKTIDYYSLPSPNFNSSNNYLAPSNFSHLLGRLSTTYRRLRNRTDNVFSTTQAPIPCRLVLFILFVLHLRFRSLVGLLVLSKTQHGVPTAARSSRHAPLPAVCSCRRDHLDRRPQLVRHGPDRDQHLLLQEMCQDGWLYLNSDLSMSVSFEIFLNHVNSKEMGNGQWFHFSF